MTCRWIGERRHTRQGYAAGCRCEGCRAAWATYCRDRKHARGLAQPRDLALVASEIARLEAELPQAESADQDVALSAQLPPLDAAILLQIQKRTRQRRGEVIARLLREHGPALLTA